VLVSQAPSSATASSNVVAGRVLEDGHFLSAAANQAILERERTRLRKEGRAIVPAVLDDILATALDACRDVPCRNNASVSISSSAANSKAAETVAAVKPEGAKAAGGVASTDPVGKRRKAADEFLRQRYPERFADPDERQQRTAQAADPRISSGPNSGDGRKRVEDAGSEFGDVGQAGAEPLASSVERSDVADGDFSAEMDFSSESTESKQQSSPKPAAEGIDAVKCSFVDHSVSDTISETAFNNGSAPVITIHSASDSVSNPMSSPDSADIPKVSDDNSLLSTLSSRPIYQLGQMTSMVVMQALKGNASEVLGAESQLSVATNSLPFISHVNSITDDISRDGVEVQLQAGIQARVPQSRRGAYQDGDDVQDFRKQSDRDFQRFIRFTERLRPHVVSALNKNCRVSCLKPKNFAHSLSSEYTKFTSFLIDCDAIITFILG
jgi:hypothetical protein